LEERLGIHQPSLSQQLGVLRSAGIVGTRREAKQVFYRLTEERAALLIEALTAIFPPE
jgi:DNA-binding transcriptional ArsR family regulator